MITETGATCFESSTCHSRCSATVSPSHRRGGLQPSSRCSVPAHPGRKPNRTHSRRWIVLNSYLLLTLLCLAASTRTASANLFANTASLDFHSELLFDRSDPPLPRMHLNRREEDRSASSSDATTSHSDTPTSTSSSAALLPSVSLVTSPLPKPFDSSLGNNFTASSCPTFFESFLSNETFMNCLPFSLLLKTSNSFFAATRDPVYLTQTLDHTCNVNFPQCSALMSSLANQITQDAACGADFRLQNPMVEQAYSGFLAYQPLYHAGCMVNNSTNSFCYVDVMSNTSATAGAFVYYLPLGLAMPGGTPPPCTSCLKETMTLFATAAVNGSTPALSETYNDAAQQIDMFCGPTFAQTDVDAPSAATLSSRPALSITVSIAAVLAFWFIV